MLSNIPNGRSDKIISFLAFGIFWFININSVNYFKYIYLFLNSSLWTVLNYNTVKYFEGKKSLSNYVIWPRGEGLKKQGTLQALSIKNKS